MLNYVGASASATTASNKSQSKRQRQRSTSVIIYLSEKARYIYDPAMAGVGEASAIIGLVSAAASLSKAVFEIGIQYTNAKAQIESLGREISILGKILDQLSRFISKGKSHIDISVHLLTTEIIDECSNMFSQLDAYNDKLYGNSVGSNPSLRAKTKWVFQAAELEYFRARVDSMKINLLLMMSLQSISAHSGFASPFIYLLRRKTKSSNRHSIVAVLSLISGSKSMQGVYNCSRLKAMHASSDY